MAKLNFPSSPSNGTLYTENGNIWRWNGTSWISYNSLDLTSQTTGALDATNDGTVLTSYTIGYVLYANTSSTISKIAAGIAGSFLASAGAGRNFHRQSRSSCRRLWWWK